MSQSEALSAEDRSARLELAEREIRAILERYRVKFVPRLTIEGAQIIHHIGLEVESE